MVIYGRKSDRNSGKLKITGTVAGGSKYEQVLDVNFQQIDGNSAIAQLWGRSRIKELMNQMYGKENKEGIDAVTQTALDYNLLSKYTAFIAVDETSKEVSQNSSDANKESWIGSKPQPAQKPSSSNFLSSQSVPVQTPSPANSQNNKSVPEPGEIVGNLFALIALTLFLTRKRWSHLLKAWLTNKKTQVK